MATIYSGEYWRYPNATSDRLRGGVKWTISDTGVLNITPTTNTAHGMRGVIDADGYLSSDLSFNSTMINAVKNIVFDSGVKVTHTSNYLTFLDIKNFTNLQAITMPYTIQYDSGVTNSLDLSWFFKNCTKRYIFSFFQPVSERSPVP